MYRLRTNGAMSGGVTVFGKWFDIRAGVVEVDNLHEMNFLVSQCGYKPLGVEAWRNKKKVVFKRGRGLGDLLMMTAVARAAKKLNPKMEIIFALDEIYLKLFQHIPYISRVITQPRLRFHGDNCWIRNADGTEEAVDWWAEFDGIAETSNEVAIKHRIDVFAEVLGFGAGSIDKTMDYVLTPDEKKWGRTKLESNGLRPGREKIMVLALRSSCRNRNFHDAWDGMPGETNRRIARLALADGWKVVVLDQDPSMRIDGPGIANLGGQLDFRGLGAVLSNCDMVIGPDSGIWHLACALKVPNTVYFGAINWKLRVSSPTTRVVFKNTACYPCDRYDCRQGRMACMALSAEDIWKPAREWANKAPRAANPGIIETRIERKENPTDKPSDQGEAQVWNQIREAVGGQLR